MNSKSELTNASNDFLMAEAKKGYETAFEELVHRHKDLLLALLQKNFRLGKERAKELLQESLMAVWDSISDLDITVTFQENVTSAADHYLQSQIGDQPEFVYVSREEFKTIHAQVSADRAAREKTLDALEGLIMMHQVMGNSRHSTGLRFLYERASNGKTIEQLAQLEGSSPDQVQMQMDKALEFIAPLLKPFL